MELQAPLKCTLTCAKTNMSVQVMTHTSVMCPAVLKNNFSAVTSFHVGKKCVPKNNKSNLLAALV